MEKMDIFISWHGHKSHAVAEALREWLPQIVNAFHPWLSSADIDKGARWSSELAGKLATARAGIICLTPGNLTAPWILFEAGALSKTVESTHVVPLLIEVEQTEVTGPLAQFQAVKPTKEEFLRLVQNLNKALASESMQDAHVERAFEKWWPDLEKQLHKLPPETSSHGPRRSEYDLLSEVVELARQSSSSIERVGIGLSDEIQRLNVLIRQDAESRHARAAGEKDAFERSLRTATQDLRAAEEALLGQIRNADREFDRRLQAERIAAVTNAAQKAGSPTLSPPPGLKSSEF